jgi:hypothetical protein
MNAEIAISTTTKTVVLSQTGTRSSQLGVLKSATRGMPPGGAVAVAIYLATLLAQVENT